MTEQQDDSVFLRRAEAVLSAAAVAMAAMQSNPTRRFDSVLRRRPQVEGTSSSSSSQTPAATASESRAAATPELRAATPARESLDTAPAGASVKLGIVFLGVVSGKRKYMLLDANDIPFVRQFVFEARMVYDSNGQGARVFAHASSNRSQAGFFHDLLWISRNGPIPDGFVVAHRNGITVDNRLANLELVRESSMSYSQDMFGDLPLLERLLRRNESNLYRVALSQLAPFTDERSRIYIVDKNGEQIEDDNTIAPFNECHHLTCCSIESSQVRFNYCEDCQSVCYCSVRCQESDRRLHKPECELIVKRRDGSTVLR